MRLGLQILAVLFFWGEDCYSKFVGASDDLVGFVQTLALLRLRSDDFEAFAATTKIVYSFAYDCYSRDVGFLGPKIVRAAMDGFCFRFHDQVGRPR